MSVLPEEQEKLRHIILKNGFAPAIKVGSYQNWSWDSAPASCPERLRLQEEDKEWTFSSGTGVVIL